MKFSNAFIVFGALSLRFPFTSPVDRCLRSYRPAVRRPWACSAERSALPEGEGSTDSSASPGIQNFGFVADDKLGVAFTCNKCKTRVAKTVSRKSYETGVVLIQCPGCKV